jgi:flagellar protein FliO/FliZ
VCSLVSQDAREAERSIVLNTTPVPAVAVASPPSTVWLFVRMIVVLALVIACIYAVVFFLKKGQKQQTAFDPFLKKTASLVLSPGKSVQVITLGDTAYIVGVSDNAVTLLGKTDDKDLINAMNLNAEENSSAAKPRDFASLLVLFSAQKRTGAAQREVGDEVIETASFLRDQRRRLNREKPQ